MESAGDIYTFTDDSAYGTRASFLPRRGTNVFLEEWLGRPAADFIAGMSRKTGRWTYATDEWTNGDRHVVEHVWTRA